MQINAGRKTLTSGEALGARIRVKLSAGTVVAAGAGEQHIGITEYAVHQLGDITYVELPELDIDVVKGAAAASVESVKAASDVYAPVTGRVTEVNDALEVDPALVNQSPYEDGWFFRLAGVSRTELSTLMDAAAYQKFLAKLEK